MSFEFSTQRWRNKYSLSRCTILLFLFDSVVVAGRRLTWVWIYCFRPCFVHLYRPVWRVSISVHVKQYTEISKLGNVKLYPHSKLWNFFGVYSRTEWTDATFYVCSIERPTHKAFHLRERSPITTTTTAPPSFTPLRHRHANVASSIFNSRCTTWPDLSTLLLSSHRSGLCL